MDQKYNLNIVLTFMNMLCLDIIVFNTVYMLFKTMKHKSQIVLAMQASAAEEIYLRQGLVKTRTRHMGHCSNNLLPESLHEGTPTCPIGRMHEGGGAKFLLFGLFLDGQKKADHVDNTLYIHEFIYDV
jgi:hypothetical protein